MLFAVIFADIPDNGDVRTQNMDAHLAWLEVNKEIIPIGGSLRKELGEVPKGGLWIAEAESKSALDALLKTDPFYGAGLRQDYEIFYWSKANAARKASI